MNSGFSAEEVPQQQIYVDNPRDDVRPFVPVDGVSSALDVGCGRGGFGRTLRDLLGQQAHIVGIEAVAEQAQRARLDHGFDEVVNGYFPQALDKVAEPTTFDLISFNDVLEHLVDPWQTLAAARAHLTNGGRVIAAIPNIQYAPVMLQLLRGRWDYADDGTLDRTHVRFFTKATMIEMFQEQGFEVLRCVGANSIADRYRTDPLAVRRLLKLGLARMLGDSAYLHFIVVARPSGANR